MTGAFDSHKNLIRPEYYTTWGPNPYAEADLKSFSAILTRSITTNKIETNYVLITKQPLNYYPIYSKAR